MSYVWANTYLHERFPAWLTHVHFIAVVALLIRFAVAFVSVDFYHPDEIFQYLEQAHRLTFGYGYVPWEYRFGTRSWILPGFISGLLSLCKGLQIDYPEIYTVFVKAVFCIFSISLIYSSYVLAREISGMFAGKLAAFFTCFWYELVYFAHKPLPEVVSTYFILAALACATALPKKSVAPLLGFLTASAIVLRLQYVPVLPVLAFFVWVKWGSRETAMMALMFVVVVGLAGYVDQLTWGGFFASFYNNYLFNAVYGVSGLFGRERFSYFFESLTIASAGLFAITGVLSCWIPRKTWLLVAVLAAIIIPHSLIPHKEYRFVFAAVPILLTLLAIVICSYRILTKKEVIGASVVIVCCLSLAGLFNKIPLQQRAVDRDFIAPRLVKEENLKAYLFLSTEPAVAAVLNTASVDWAVTGGYYYLHRDVPIYRREHLSPDDDLHRYVSHIVCPITDTPTPGFVPILTMKKLEVRRQINPPDRYAMLSVDTKNVLQEGIDDRFTPTVRKLF